MMQNSIICFPISADILDVEYTTQAEDATIIPIKLTDENKKRYDETYATLGENCGFLYDITCSKLNLIVKVNAIQQFEFYIGASYREFCIEDIPYEQLEKYDNQVSITLSCEELLAVSVLFNADTPSIEDLRLQVSRAIPSEHMKDTMLFAEEETQRGYRSVWATEDFKKCVLAFIENVVDRGDVVKAFVFG